MTNGKTTEEDFKSIVGTALVPLIIVAIMFGTHSDSTAWTVPRIAYTRLTYSKVLDCSQV